MYNLYLYVYALKRLRTRALAQLLSCARAHVHSCSLTTCVYWNVLSCFAPVVYDATLKYKRMYNCTHTQAATGAMVTEEDKHRLGLHDPVGWNSAGYTHLMQVRQYMCPYIHMYIYLCIMNKCIYEYIYIDIYIQKYIYKYIYIYIFIYIYVYTGTYICIHMRIYIYIYACT